ncbi:hypothetical protein FMEAI12_5770014 [Parafrankia sp. Ea1.12]|nr:hypothetical protein FMEAI12_5770014 [Parafrankia sp. Ea1.12]
MTGSSGTGTEGLDGGPDQQGCPRGGAPRCRPTGCRRGLRRAPVDTGASRTQADPGLPLRILAPGGIGARSGRQYTALFPSARSRGVVMASVPGVPRAIQWLALS